MGKLCNAGHISNLTWCKRYSISSTFRNSSRNWENYVFHWEKWNFEPVWNFAPTKEFLTLGKALLTLLPFYLQTLAMQISTQIDNHKYRKSVAISIYSLKKWVWSFKTLNSIFYMQNSFYFFYMKCQPFGVQSQMRPFWNKEKRQNRIMIICFNFLELVSTIFNKFFTKW